MKLLKNQNIDYQHLAYNKNSITFASRFLKRIV